MNFWNLFLLLVALTGSILAADHEDLEKGPKQARRSGEDGGQDAEELVRSSTKPGGSEATDTEEGESYPSVRVVSVAGLGPPRPVILPEHAAPVIGSSPSASAGERRSDWATSSAAEEVRAAYDLVSREDIAASALPFYLRSIPITVRVPPDNNVPSKYQVSSFRSVSHLPPGLMVRVNDWWCSRPQRDTEVIISTTKPLLPDGFSTVSLGSSLLLQVRFDAPNPPIRNCLEWIDRYAVAQRPPTTPRARYVVNTGNLRVLWNALQTENPVAYLLAPPSLSDISDRDTIPPIHHQLYRLYLLLPALITAARIRDAGADDQAALQTKGILTSTVVIVEGCEFRPLVENPSVGFTTAGEGGPSLLAFTFSILPTPQKTDYHASKIEFRVPVAAASNFYDVVLRRLETGPPSLGASGAAASVSAGAAAGGGS